MSLNCFLTKKNNKMKDNTIVWAVDFLIKCEESDKIICFAMTIEDLTIEVKKLGKKINTGIYYIYECLQYYSKQDIINTGKYFVVL